MPVYRIDFFPEEEQWKIKKEKSRKEKKNTDYVPALNKIWNVENTLPNKTVTPKDVVWVDQPNPLAAFSHALMLFNGEI